MCDELYTDGVSEITVGGGIVRVDLFSLSPSERDPSNAPKKVLRQRLIFSVQGFANSVSIMQQAVQGLIEADAVKRTDVRGTDTAKDPHYDERTEALAKSMEKPANGSSNFS